MTGINSIGLFTFSLKKYNPITADKTMMSSKANLGILLKILVVIIILVALFSFILNKFKK